MAQNHPSNPITQELAGEFHLACRLIRETESVRVALVTASGPVFSTAREPVPPDVISGGPDARIQWLQEMQVAQSLANLSIPTIAVINGDAFDHGLELALAADLRVCAESARFGFTGLEGGGNFPWDGATQRLSRLVGPAWAADLLLTSRTIESSEAMAIGLVNRVVPQGELLSEAAQLAENIAQAAPIAARYAKEAVHRSRDLGLTEGFRLEADLNFLLHTTEDRAEGLKSFADKRPPQFTGR